MSHSLMKKVLALLAERLAALMETRQIFFVMDVSRPHIHYSIVNEACRFGFWVIFIPAKLTWLLQPLDVYAFARYNKVQ